MGDNTARKWRMNMKKKRINTLNIIFMILAVLFLCVVVFEFYNTFTTIGTYKESYTMKLLDEIHEYITRVGPFLAYSIIFYGLAEMNKHIGILHSALDCSADEALSSDVKEEIEKEVEVEVKETETEINE